MGSQVKCAVPRHGTSSRSPIGACARATAPADSSGCHADSHAVPRMIRALLLCALSEPEGSYSLTSRLNMRKIAPNANAVGDALPRVRARAGSPHNNNRSNRHRRAHIPRQRKSACGGNHRNDRRTRQRGHPSRPYGHRNGRQKTHRVRRRRLPRTRVSQLQL
jgi:hypothetical protein